MRAFESVPNLEKDAKWNLSSMDENFLYLVNFGEYVEW